MRLFLIYMTTADKAEARSIGEHLVKNRLAACVNIIDNMNSMYYWQGNFEDDQETVMIAKTSEEKVSELIKAVKERHSYDCPCIVSLPIEGGNPGFLEWIEQGVRWHER